MIVVTFSSENGHSATVAAETTANGFFGMVIAARLENRPAQNDDPQSMHRADVAASLQRMKCNQPTASSCPADWRKVEVLGQIRPVLAGKKTGP
jgi:hypothetical protein